MSTDVQTLEQEFIEDYRLACKKAVEEYKSSPEPENPVKMFYTRNWDWSLMNTLGEKYKDLVSKMMNNREDHLREVWYSTFTITRETQVEMEDWFKTAGYDYKNIPAAPAIDHETPHKIKYWRIAYRGGDKDMYESLNPFSTVYLVGSVLVQPSTWRGTKTIKFSLASSTALFPIKLECSGSREDKKALEEKAFKLASELSRLTDWSVFSGENTKINRSIYEKVKELRVRYGV